MLVVLCKNVKTLDFHGKTVTIPSDTVVYFDLDENIAFWNDIHFFLSKEEYLIMN